MNKFFIGLFLVVFLISSGLAGYFFYLNRNASALPAQLNTSTSTGANSVNTSDPNSWLNLQTKILSDCQETPVFETPDADTAYIQNLFNSLGSDVKYATSDASFSSASNEKFDIVPLYPSRGSVPSGRTSNCVVVWVGDNNGTGKAAYQNLTNQITQLDVTQYPVPSQ